ncbi:MAG: Na+/H+ antiporter [Proteobacteria bacterium]|nr:Na+/H+ antiporter [Pseudomonadota bacterium]
MTGTNEVELILVLLVAATLLAVLAQRLNLAYPIVLVLGGLALGLVPGLPRVALDPELVFTLFLPPLLFSAAFFMPWPEFKANLREILLLAVGLVVATTVAVAYVAWATIGLPLAIGFVLGAIVSPPDAIAATAIAERLKLPHRLVVVLEGESLINDAAGLVLFRFAVAAVVVGAFSVSGALLEFAKVAVGGVALGLVVAWLSIQLFRRIADAGIVTVLTLFGPFAAYLPAELLGFSGVLATVSAGIYVGWRSPTVFTPATRVRAGAVWTTLVFLLNGLAFILIGLQLPFILREIADEPPVMLAVAALSVIGAVILVRIVWILGSSALTGVVAPRLCARKPLPRWEQLTVLSWAGMRGIVSLAAALALPTAIASGAPFPNRGLVLFLAFSVILATLVLQGLTLPSLVRALGVGGADDGGEEKIEARRFSLEAAIMRIDELAKQDDLPADDLAHLRLRYEHALRVLDERDADAGDIDTHRRLQLELIAAERQVLLDLRRNGAISHDVFRDLERALDMRVAWLE